MSSESPEQQSNDKKILIPTEEQENKSKEVGDAIISSLDVEANQKNEKPKKINKRFGCSW